MKRNAVAGSPTPATSGGGRTAGEIREREWLEQEVAQAASLSDAERIRILRDLLRTAEAIRRGKSPAELRRDEEIRQILDEAPGRSSYLAAVERAS